MKFMVGLRVMLTLLVAVLLSLGQAHCALMAHTAPIAVQADRHDDGDHGCCPESAPSPGPTSPADPCCCDSFHLPAVTAPALVWVDAPVSAPAPLAIMSAVAASLGAQTAFVRLEPEARSGSPPDPSTAPQSPRGPPHST